MSQSTPIRRPSYTPSLSGTPGSPALEQPSPSFSRRVSTASSSTAATQYAHANPSPADRKKRSRLRDYYGLAKGAAPKSGQSLDIDSPAAFDADAYFNSLVSTASLPDLLRRENDLLNEIRELDGERQSLVYNHHHELIDASDTIRKMKSRAESLDQSLESLKSSFESIAQLSGSLATLSTRPPGAPVPSRPARSPLTTPDLDEARSPASGEPQSPKTPRPNRRRSSRSETITSPTAGRTRSASTATLSSHPVAVPSVPFSPLLHTSALLALPIVLDSLVSCAPTDHQHHQQQRAKADSLWGAWEPALRSWEDAGVEGAREIGMECREVLRHAAARRSESVSSPL
ncbi:hypothetical protein BMF94_6666 [Rhodotorula taiwanensis]|uniref:Vacuolar protein sorting-associated protein 51 homolog n=1 Tax=Rhodotorula taiwanensis TaxID=741276 RepID=A0A2S5B0V5_9BASI|nr:hypothetical protein BMF94_6666 [Rhodotorula taiwanensis]